MQQKIESMAEKQTTIKRSQEVILRTRNTILCRLDIIERALHIQPQNHSTPYQHRQPRFAEVDSSWPHEKNQWFDEDDYGSEWNRADNTIYPPTSYTGGPVRPHHSFVAPYSGNNQHSFNSLDLPADQHSFNLQPISTASTHFILQLISTASTRFILQPISTASTRFILQPISTASTRFILQLISTTLTSKLLSTAWTRLSLFLLNSLVIVCLLLKLTRQNFNQLKPFCTNSLNFIVSQK